MVKAFDKRMKRNDNISIQMNTFIEEFGPSVIKFTFLRDKINYVWNIGGSILFRMINGFSCQVFIENRMFTGGFITPMSCVVTMPVQSYAVLVKWLGGLNPKKKK